MKSLNASLMIRLSSRRPDQDSVCDSFVGGRPKLPPNVMFPMCGNCGSTQTFFFQVAFPEGQLWAGRSLAVFGCEACRDMSSPVPLLEKSLFPSMKHKTMRKGEDLPDGVLDLYQKVGRFVVFDTTEGIVRTDYPERLRYRRIRLDPAEVEKATTKSKVGGQPGWIYPDE